MECGDDTWEVNLPIHRRHPYFHFADAQFGRGLQLMARELQLVEDAVGSFQEQERFRACDDLPGLAGEQKNAELILKLLDCNAQRRLRDAQLSGGFGEAAMTRNGLAVSEESARR